MIVEDDRGEVGLQFFTEFENGLVLLVVVPVHLHFVTRLGGLVQASKMLNSILVLELLK